MTAPSPTPSFARGLGSRPEMESQSCPVVYIDERVKDERWISREDIGPLKAKFEQDVPGHRFHEGQEFLENVEVILKGFQNVYVCNSGKTFSSKIAELYDSLSRDCIPIFALYDIGFKEKASRTRSELEVPVPVEQDPQNPTIRRTLTFRSESEESHGLQLLSKISSDVQVQDDAKIVISVAVLRSAARSPTTPNSSDAENEIPPAKAQKCLDAGAVDVLTSPLQAARIAGLSILAYRYHKDATKEQQAFLSTRKIRKQSWVGLDDQKPYAYLRESMVSKLMLRICSPKEVNDFVSKPVLHIDNDRQAAITEAVGSWSFCAHDFTEEELVFAGTKMLGHALTMPEVQEWSLSTEQLERFMQASRAAYNSFVLYHNFRHAVDVLQSLFTFLLRVGALPPYGPDAKSQTPTKKSPIGELLKPFETLTLLIAAIGHDVGHPGVNNAFLVNLNAPLAQLYNDVSVLEAFHCAAFSQILRQHWPEAFESRALRKLLISNILATDMALHAKYIEDLGNLQAHYHSSKSVDTWNPQQIDKYKVLVSGLLIKCADISNVARPWHIAEQWTDILQKEFANQGEMEKEVGMETALFGGPPEIGNILKLANGQIFFMGMLAHPLFAGMADILPGMDFAQAQILANKSVWEDRVEHEKQRLNPLRHDSIIVVSPRTKPPKHPGGPTQGASPVDGFSRQTNLRQSIAVPPPLSLNDKCEKTPKQSTDSSHTQQTEPISGVTTFNVEDLPQDVFGLNSQDDSGWFSGNYSGRFRGTWVEGEINGLVNDQPVNGTFAQHVVTGAPESGSPPQQATLVVGHNLNPQAGRGASGSTAPNSSGTQSPPTDDTQLQRNSRLSTLSPMKLSTHQISDAKNGINPPQTVSLTPSFLDVETPTSRNRSQLKARPTSSPPIITNSPLSGSSNGRSKAHEGYPGNGDSTGSGEQHRLPRRRSRMRLAFWRKKQANEDSIET